MTKLIPRYYQQEAVDSVFHYFASGNTGNPIIAMPTGTGKSIVIGGFIQKVFEYYPNQRILKLTHVHELISQNFDKLLRMWPSAPAGIYSAGIGRKETHNKITFAGIQSIAKKVEAFGHIDLILIDECHLVGPKADTTYQKVIKALLDVNPYLKVIGLTATPYRIGQGLLTDGGLFNDFCYDITDLHSFNRLVEEGYLSPLIAKPTTTTIDLTGVKTRLGDFVNKELQAATDREEITWCAIQEVMYYGHDRNHWLVFATGIEHCDNIVNMFDAFNVSAVAVHNNISAQEREEAFASFRSGKYKALVNYNVATTGYDFDGIDLIAAIRATQSPGLWVQMLGRGTRPLYAPGFDLTTDEGRLTAIAAGPKQNCLVLDFARNTERLGPINDPVIPRKKGAKKGSGTAPIRLCDGCNTYVHASLRLCPHCGYTFPIQVNFRATAGVAEVMVDDQSIVDTFKVDRVVYSTHRKKGKPPSLKVSYYCGLRVFKTYVCLEHMGYPAKKARAWWVEAAANQFTPDTIEDALEWAPEVLREPISLRIWINKKHPEILSYEY